MTPLINAGVKRVFNEAGRIEIGQNARRPLLGISTLHVLALILAFGIFLCAAQGETVLYSFASQADASHPLVGLIADSAGNLYGQLSSTAAQKQEPSSNCRRPPSKVAPGPKVFSTHFRGDQRWRLAHGESGHG